MPAKTTELTDKEQFRGDILDRDFPVHYDAKTGAYSYDYAEVTPEIASELKKMKYYRVSSPKLSDVEQELIKKLKGEGSRIGEITKASQERASEIATTLNEYGEFKKRKNEGTPLTEEERVKFKKTLLNLKEQMRPRKASNAKKTYNFIQEEANEKGININALKKKGPANAMSENEKQFKMYLPLLAKVEAIIDAYEVLERLGAKGTALTPAELTEKEAAEKTINSMAIKNLGEPLRPLKATLSRLEGQEAYNNARALVTQIEGIPEASRTNAQKKNLANAKTKIQNFEKDNYEVLENVEEKKRSIEKAMREKYKSKFNAATATMATLAGKTTLTPDEQAKKTSTQAILNAYTNYTNPFSTDKEKSNAEAILKSAPSANNTVSLQGAFPPLPTPFEGYEEPKKGGKRRTHKSKKSKRKTRKQY